MNTILYINVDTNGCIDTKIGFDHTQFITVFNGKYGLDIINRKDGFIYCGISFTDEIISYNYTVGDINYILYLVKNTRNIYRCNQIINKWDLCLEYVDKLYNKRILLSSSILLGNISSLVTRNCEEADYFIDLYFNDENIIGLDTEFINTFSCTVSKVKLCVIQIATDYASLVFYIDPKENCLPNNLVKLLESCITKIAIDPRNDVKLLKEYCNIINTVDICQYFRDKYYTRIQLGTIKILRIMGYHHSKELRRQKWDIFDLDNVEKWTYAILDPILAIKAYRFITSI